MAEPGARAGLPKTLEEFRTWHDQEDEVYEFIDGITRLMAPGSKAHTIIKGNVGSAFKELVRGKGCHVLIEGAVIEVAGCSLIPDVVVTCGSLDLTTPRVDEPLIIVEILSPSSEKDDIGRKLSLYLQIPSLRHYLVIHQDRQQIVVHQRSDALDGQFLTNIAPGDPITLDPPGIRLSFASVYEDIPHLGRPD